MSCREVVLKFEYEGYTSYYCMKRQIWNLIYVFIKHFPIEIKIGDKVLDGNDIASSIKVIDDYKKIAAYHTLCDDLSDDILLDILENCRKLGLIDNDDKDIRSEFIADMLVSIAEYNQKLKDTAFDLLIEMVKIKDMIKIKEYYYNDYSYFDNK